MAQNSQSFLYRLVVNLEDEGAFSEMSQQVARFSDVTEQARGKINNLLGTIIDDINPAKAGFEDLERKIIELDQNQSVEGLSRDLKEVQQDLLRAARNSEEINFNEAVKAGARLENQVERIERAQMEANASAKQLGAGVSGVGTAAANVTPKTNMMSQSILQGMQDAQFGVIGVANNIQMAGQQLAQAQQRGFTFGQVMKSTMRSLIMGPMAIGTAITLITLMAQNWDSVTAAVKETASAFNLANEEWSELTSELSTGREVLEKMKEEMDSGQKILMGLNEEAREYADNIIQDRIEQEERALEVLKAQRDESINYREIQRELIDQGFTIEEARQRAVKLTEQRANAQSDIKQAIEFQKTELENMRVTQTILNDEEAKREEKIERIADLETFTRKQAERIVALNKENNDELDKSVEKTAKIRKLAAELAGGLEGSFMELRIQMDELRNELKPEEGGLLDRFLGRIEEQRGEKIVSEFMDNLVGEMKEGMEELGIAEESNEIFIPGFGVVNPEKELKRQREFFRTTQKTLKQQIQTTKRQRKEGGPEAGGLFGGFIQTENVFEEQFSFQQRLLKQEEEQRLERLQNARDFQETKAILLGPNSKEGQAAISRARALQRQITQVEDEYQRRREENQKEHLREKIKGTKTAGLRILSDSEQIASGIFNTWKRERQNELENLGKTQEEQRKILKKEGKKRFQAMKAIKIANTIATGITAAHEAWNRGMEIPFAGGPALAATFSGLSLAKTALEVRKLSSLSIGDKLPGGGGAGGGGGMPSGQFTQLSASRNAQRAADFGSQAQRNRRSSRASRENSMQKAADKINKAADKIQNQKVTYDDPTAEDIQNRGQQRSDSLNI